MSLHFPIAFALQAIVPLVAPAGSIRTEVSKVKVEDYSDIANKYVALKYSNGYLKFWDDVHSDRSLMATKMYEMHVRGLPFFAKKNQGNKWGSLVIFCKKIRNKIEDGRDLNDRELKNVGGCDKGDSISRSKEMNTRAYWVDMFARTRYKAEDFKFGDNLWERMDERAAKQQTLILERGYSPDLLKKVKAECQVVRDKFEGKSKDKLTEEDLNKNIPVCLSSLRAR